MTGCHVWGISRTAVIGIGDSVDDPWVLETIAVRHDPDRAVPWRRTGAISSSSVAPMRRRSLSVQTAITGSLAAGGTCSRGARPSRRRVDANAVGHLLDRGDGLLASLADDVRGADLPSQGLTIGLPGESIGLKPRFISPLIPPLRADARPCRIHAAVRRPGPAMPLDPWDVVERELPDASFVAVATVPREPTGGMKAIVLAPAAGHLRLAGADAQANSHGRRRPRLSVELAGAREGLDNGQSRSSICALLASSSASRLRS